MDRITSFATQFLAYSANCNVLVFLMNIDFITQLFNFVFQKSESAKTSIIKCFYLHPPPVAEIETLEVPPFSPTSKEVLGQAVKASFAGFSQERTKHHFPHGRTTH